MQMNVQSIISSTDSILPLPQPTMEKLIVKISRSWSGSALIIIIIVSIIIQSEYFYLGPSSYFDNYYALKLLDIIGVSLAIIIYAAWKTYRNIKSKRNPSHLFFEDSWKSSSLDQKAGFVTYTVPEIITIRKNREDYSCAVKAFSQGDRFVRMKVLEDHFRQDDLLIVKSNMAESDNLNKTLSGLIDMAQTSVERDINDKKYSPGHH